MKKTIISSLTVLLALMTCACDQEQPIDTDQYPQSVYIVGAHDRIITRELHLGYDQDTLNLSVAISGSRSLSHDVDVTIAECPEAIYNYDSREISPEYRQYRPPRSVHLYQSLEHRDGEERTGLSDHAHLYQSVNAAA